MPRKKQEVELTADQIEERKAQRKRERRERFVKLVNKRIPATLKRLQGVANMANRNVYDYTDGEAHEVVNVLIEAVNYIKQQFLRGDGGTDQTWRLPGT